MFDTVKGDGEHHIESRFQFAPGPLLLLDNGAKTAWPDANLLVLTAGALPFSESHIEEGQEAPRGGWYSDSYGKIEPAPALSLSLRSTLPWTTATLLFPWHGAEAPNIQFSFTNRLAELHHPQLGHFQIKPRQ